MPAREPIDPRDVYPERSARPAARILDVRAPVEVARGALPGARNLPILEDDERHLVGLRYAEAGQEAAYRLGLELTRDRMEARAEAWRAEIDAARAAGRPVAFACWRGGLRSRLAREYAGRDDVPRVAGGTKALRAELMAGLGPSLARRATWVATGATGTGKTEWLAAVSGLPGLRVVDLEGLAGHRGSAFGRRGPQPAQATFENALAAELRAGDEGTLLLEDESHRIGDRILPEGVARAIGSGATLELVATLDERVARIHRDYFVEPAERVGPEAARDEALGALARLRRRLGGATADRMASAVRDAYAAPGRWRDPEALRGVITGLLEGYYDPLYRKAAAKLDRPALARGTKEELQAWTERATRP